MSRIEHYNGVTYRSLGTTGRGWELQVAQRDADGVCWAVVYDGITAHDWAGVIKVMTAQTRGTVAIERPAVRPSLEDAAGDALQLVEYLETLARLSKLHAVDGPN